MADATDCCLGMELGALCACCCAAAAADAAQDSQQRTVVVQPVLVVQPAGHSVPGQYVQSPSGTVHFVPVGQTYPAHYQQAIVVEQHPYQQISPVYQQAYPHVQIATVVKTANVV
ncbi:Aste57867_23062 [Aphanomyces stellatus]|uniref:Aste57867_23062 protein n=1 Tax=Aphanomyces stellatus TaxID=120398 RepID=A0A485LRD6_9STRA|nr:hypothetical protein As57867_022991 [Aphanomyces stellatus]VFT99710.1 Aste57867_23062 [Aphanomyces stellatus]